ncbi:MAG: 4Fe-4S dicluster domain-containing protein, partial [Promethearchaeota archaeon]
MYGVQKARKAFNEKQWESGLVLANCKACGECEKRCPNNLPVL